MRKVIVPGKFPSLNKYITACRKSPYAGAEMIKNAEKKIIKALEREAPLKPPIRLNYLYIEENRKRDKDNVAGFFHKVFQDSLVKSGLLDNDGWNYIAGWKDDFTVDKNNPRVVIMIFERTKE